MLKLQRGNNKPKPTQKRSFRHHKRKRRRKHPREGGWENKKPHQGQDARDRKAPTPSQQQGNPDDNEKSNQGLTELSIVMFIDFHDFHSGEFANVKHACRVLKQTFHAVDQTAAV